MPTVNKLNLKKILILICSLTVTLAIILSIYSHNANAQEPYSASPDTAVAPKGLVEVKMTGIGVDPVKNELETRLQFELKGIYKKGPTYPAQDLLMTVNGANVEDSEITFKEGKPMIVPALKFNLVKGKINNYPFDTHIAKVAISIDPLASMGKKFAPFELNPVPLAFKFNADVPGFDISYKPLEENSSIFIYIDVSATRSLPVKFFALVIIVIMWVLSIMALLLALKVMKSGKLPEVGMLSWTAVMLFAFPAIRNAQPGVPPVGTASDFLSFFWTEIIVVVALVIIGSCWLKRYHPPIDE
ncbi:MULTISPECIES: DUF4436 family protein [unclassified Microcoleus]|uniref:DUF4436 family protein n=1 Tax=unclassified Microcoleus TaxID=2642155 RepID=UPI002FCF8186